MAVGKLKPELKTFLTVRALPPHPHTQHKSTLPAWPLWTPALENSKQRWTAVWGGCFHCGSSGQQGWPLLNSLLGPHSHSRIMYSFILSTVDWPERHVVNNAWCIAWGWPISGVRTYLETVLFQRTSFLSLSQTLLPLSLQLVFPGYWGSLDPFIF